MNIEDYILIRRIQNGDTEAFETLVQKYTKIFITSVFVAATEIQHLPLT